MRSFSKLFRKAPRQPDMTFAADGFFPIAVMQMNNVDADLNAIADAHAESLLKNGCTINQALSAKWGGAVAIGQDMRLFQSYAAAYDDAFEATAADVGQCPEMDEKSAFRARQRAAATMFLSQILAESPEEYERFLRYIGK